MTNSVDIKGDRNKVILIKDGKKIPYEPINGITITIKGNNEGIITLIHKERPLETLSDITSGSEKMWKIKKHTMKMKIILTILL